MEVPPAFALAVEQFNQGEYYACHDTLEALWHEASEPHRTLYQGLLQIAVAGYHHRQGNLRGATLLLGEGLTRLRRCPELPAEWDFAALIAQAQTLLEALQQAPATPPAFTLTLPRLS
ncbi:MAG: DUF309 domain-containing protein [Gloeomargarita sp. SKYBB_i_bin120]|nr:DUF309 domain-containing protein [Gloeomargarita sp. SKYG98]MCS7291599.1 DUF309 domain-containing protein [Gloeomargarita sp. SKYB120]MDW8177159.1 DUF309 domain-containing protein [Gloeomargarita sp. SKYBB_i_bin120]